ncbi:Membrane protein involved in the export of O-antigen and teichoic acid [Robiginitalea myxolifaciens]|uniref:Membrane protein involved in the export of O-antigen and teichoic acid n=1 Tax=Robiginitalea myxolifaciens TaxID=400055 RepID=A0A1I6FN11_9FLAO|nr:oligosaccharide flippase family protein [Robiginitalea myxolifaciens]SFR31326.1 Membrane protein involved in the export of O-antigen and teichoic acid [Robiginitalea myxolifaciens]
MLFQKLKDLTRNRERNYVFFSQVAGAFIALISGKVIALYVSPEDFGLYGIQFATFTFFTSLMVSPAIQFAKASNTTFIPRIGSSYYLRTVFFSVLISFVCLLLFFWWYFGNLSLSLILILFVFFPINTANKLLNDQLNIGGRLITFSNLGLLRALLGLLFLFLFFVLGWKFTSDVNALWLMQLVGSALGLLLFYKTYITYRQKFQVHFYTYFKRYLKFAWPLASLAIWTWISNYFDRYAIEAYLDIEQVGIYSASYGVGSKFFLTLSPIFLILLTPKVFSKSKNEEKIVAIIKKSWLYLALALPILVLIYFTRGLIGNILLSTEYQEGFYLIFWIAAAFFTYTISQFFEIYFYAGGRTKIILLINVVGATINILLNVIIIPILGIWGAAISTFFSFTIQALMYLVLVLKIRRNVVQLSGLNK